MTFPVLHPTAPMLTAAAVLIAAIFADTVLGVLRSFVKGTFHMAYVGSFVQTAILPYVGGVLVAWVFAAVNAQAQTLAVAATYGAAATMVGDVGTKLGINLGFLIPRADLSTGVAVAEHNAATEPAPADPPKQG